MKKVEVRELICSALAPVISPAGFHRRKKEEVFLRLTPSGNQTIGVPLADYNPIFLFSLVVTVRIDSIESITNQFNEAPQKYHSMTTSFIGQMSRFMPTEQSARGNWQFEVSTDADIKSALSRLLPVVSDRILPFLNEHQDVHSIARAMQLDVFPSFVSSASQAFSPVTIARLAGRSDFDAIVAGYLNCMRQLPELEIQKFKRLVEHLKTHPFQGETSISQFT
jgi:hypothetical protein